MIDLKQLSELITRSLAEVQYPGESGGLYTPVEYTLESGGKRLRPVLCLAACEAICGNAERAINQAVAIEMFHNFTLIHDDVMDRSDKRRGRPTVYSKWGDVQAILSGDALLTMATERVMMCDDNLIRPILDTFNHTAQEVYIGQQLDMEFEDRDDVTVEEYLRMIFLKTSALLCGATRLGAIAGGASEMTQAALYKYSKAIGLAFQLRDDWLDTFGDPDIFGKPIGGDIVNRKKTWLYITAMNEAPGAMACALADNPGRTELVHAVTKIYNSLNLSERCDSLINSYYNQAVEAISEAGISQSDCEWFISLAQKLSHRNS